MATDIFGAEIPDTPPMDAPLPFVAWCVKLRGLRNPEFWAARTETELRDCLTCYERTDIEGIHEATVMDSAMCFSAEGDVVDMRAYVAQELPKCKHPCFLCGGEE